MSYFDRKQRMKLVEQKLKEKQTNEEILKTKKSDFKFSVGDKVKYKDDEGVIKLCDLGKCVLGIGTDLVIADAKDITLIKSATLDESAVKEEFISSNEYHVEAYNKDADTYTEFLVTNDYDRAMQKAVELTKLLLAGKLIDTDGEPFDWVQITLDDVAIWVSEKKNIGTYIEESKSDETSIKEDVKADVVTTVTDVPEVEAPGIQSATQTAITSLLKDNLSLNDRINSVILTLIDANGDTAIIDNLTSILANQNVSIGKLYELLKTVNPQSELTVVGEESVSTDGE